MDELRLDLYLKRCRLIKRRALANAACSEGLILLNGAAARPGKKVRVGDRLNLRHGGRLLELAVVALPRKGERKVFDGDLPYRILTSSPAPRQEKMEVVFLFEDFEEEPEEGGGNDSEKPGR
jgi:ribosomal 50S subunit-recycling heat shock protein